MRMPKIVKLIMSIFGSFGQRLIKGRNKLLMLHRINNYQINIKIYINQDQLGLILMLMD